MKRLRRMLRLCELLCELLCVMLFVYAALLCLKMSGGYESGWTASYCLPRIGAAAASIYGLDKVGEWFHAEICHLLREEKRKLATSGLFPTERWRA